MTTMTKSEGGLFLLQLLKTFLTVREKHAKESISCNYINNEPLKELID